MLSIVHWFNNQGCDAVLVRFSGHYENPRNTAAITIEGWQQDIVNGYESAREISKQYQVPIFIVG